MYDAQRTNGARAPLWYDELTREDARTLEANAGLARARVDLIVVGAGMRASAPRTTRASAARLSS